MADENKKITLPGDGDVKFPTFEKPKKKERKGLIPWLFGGGRSGSAFVSTGAGGSSSGMTISGMLGKFIPSLSGVGSGGGLLGTIFGTKLGAIAAMLLISAGIVAGSVFIAKGGFWGADDKMMGASSLAGGQDMRGGDYNRPSSGRVANTKSSLELFADRNSAMSAGSGLKKSSNLEDEKMPVEAETKAAAATQEPVASAEPPRLSDALGNSQFSNFSAGGVSGGGIAAAGKMSNIADGLSSFKSPVPSAGLPGVGGPTSGVAKKFDTSARFKHGRSSMSRRAGSNKALSQARGIKTAMPRAGTTSGDVMRGQTDAAWDGANTSGDTSTGGPGISTGDPDDTTTGNTDDDGNTPGVVVPDIDSSVPALSAPEAECNAPTASGGSDDSPWASLSMIALILVMIGIVLLFVIGLLADCKITYPLAFVVACIVAGLMGLVATVLGVMMMTGEGQMAQGIGISIAGIALMVGAYMAATAGSAASAATSAMVAALVAAVVMLISSMLGG